MAATDTTAELRQESRPSARRAPGRRARAAPRHRAQRRPRQRRAPGPSRHVPTEPGRSRRRHARRRPPRRRRRSARSPRTTARSRWPTRPASPRTGRPCGRRRRSATARTARARVTARGDFDFYLIEDATAGQLLTVDVDAASIGSGLDSFVAVIDATGASSPSTTTPRSSTASCRSSPGRRRLPRRRRRVRVAADQPVRLGQRHRRDDRGALRADAVVRVRRGRRRLPRRPAPRRRARRRRHRRGRVVEVLRPGRPRWSWVRAETSAAFYPDASPLRVARQRHGRPRRRRRRTALPARLARRRRVRGRPAPAPAGLESARRGRAPDPLPRLRRRRSSTRPRSGPTAATLSPLADFLAGWGLGPDDEDAVIDAIVATFTENVRRRPARRVAATRASTSRSATAATTPTRGASRTSPGSSSAAPARSSASTPFGLAESVDPGNFAREETGVVLLDQASAPAGSGPRTINDFVTPGHRHGRPRRPRRSASSPRTRPATSSATGTPQPNNGVISIMDTFDITQLGLGPRLRVRHRRRRRRRLRRRPADRGPHRRPGHVEPHGVRAVDPGAPAALKGRDQVETTSNPRPSATPI